MSATPHLAIVPGPRSLYDERVEAIRDKMLDGQWRGAAEAVSLSKEWKLSLSSVREYIRAAEGQIRAISRGDLDAARVRFVATVDRYRVIAEDLIESSEKAAPGALKAALIACDMIARMQGLYPAKEISITSRSAWKELSPEEKRERLSAAKERIAELEGELVEAAKESA